MKKLIATTFIISLLAWPSLMLAAEKETTIKGDALCLKCELGKSDSCQTAIRAKEDGKEVIYALAPNKVSKDFHSEICQSVVKVQATGKVNKQDGKMVLVASKIEKVK